METGKWHEVESLDEFRFQEIRIFLFTSNLLSIESNRGTTLLRDHFYLLPAWLHTVCFVGGVSIFRPTLRATLTLTGYLHFSSYTEHFMLYIPTKGVIPGVLFIFQLVSLPGVTSSKILSENSYNLWLIRARFIHSRSKRCNFTPHLLITYGILWYTILFWPTYQPSYPIHSNTIHRIYVYTVYLICLHEWFLFLWFKCR